MGMVQEGRRFILCGIGWGALLGSEVRLAFFRTKGRGLFFVRTWRSGLFIVGTNR